PSSNPPAASASGAGGAFAVQVAAVGSDAAAQGTITALRGAGFEPRVVREGGFIKIRVGHFAQRAEAVAAASQVRSKLGGSPFVVVEQ
ncbi:MAG: SPOR domain-containing protein, partial [Gemmatimonadota bacterium]